MSERNKIYKALSAYGLLTHLRNVVAARRFNGDTPSRDTVWRAYNIPEESLTPLHTLIMKCGDEILVAHEKEINRQPIALA